MEQLLLYDVLSESELTQAIEHLQADGIGAFSYRVDVTNKEQIDKMVLDVLERWGKLISW